MTTENLSNDETRQSVDSIGWLCDVRKHIKTLTDSERGDFFYDMIEGYCRHCGTPDENCQCWNDE